MNLREQIDRELQDLTPGKEILLDILNNTKKRPFRPKPGLFLCAVLLGLLLAVPASARVYDTIRETTHITEENRELINQADIAASESHPADEAAAAKTADLMDDPERVSEVTNGIIREIEDGTILPNTVTVITLSSASDENVWEIPELLTGPGFCTIFAKENGEGWELKAGESLQIQYSIGAAAENPDTPQKRMQIGYIGNHVFQEGGLYYTQDFEYTLYAPEDGVYYLYNINCSAGKILITEGEIR